jgi:hypothetical protein
MNTSPFRIHKRLVNALFILLLTIPLADCVKIPAEPVIPEWETPVNITVLNKIFYFSDLVAKDSKFDTTTGILLYRPTSNAIGSRQGLPADVFSMPSPKGNIIQQDIGVVPVDIGTPPTFSLTAAQLGINSANLNPSFPAQTVVLSPSQLGIPTGVTLFAEIPTIPVNQNFGDTTKFSYITFSDGTTSLKITNNFPFNIQFSGNQLLLVNFNKPADSTEVVAAFTFSGVINAGASMTSTPVNLAGTKMDGILKLKGTMSTTNATGKTLTAANNLTSEVTFVGAKIQSMVPDPAPPVALNQVFGDSTNFKFIIFDSGTMKLSITNTFPFDIQFSGNSVKLVNKNDTTQVVGDFVFAGPITAGSSATSNTIQLGNKRMDAVMKLQGNVTLTNYFGKNIVGTEKLTSTLTLENGYLQSASVSTINFNPTSVLAIPDSAVRLDDSIKVKLAKFESGAMKIRIVNKAALKLSVKFSISELKDNTKGGAVYQLPGTDPVTGIKEIDPNDSVVTTIDMKDISFVSSEKQGIDTVSTLDLHFSLEIKTLKASSGYVTVNKTDQVIAEVSPSGSFVLQEVQGKIPPQALRIDQSFDVGIGDIGNNLTLKGIKSAINLSVKVLTTGLFPTDVNLHVVPVNKNGLRADSVKISKRIMPGDPSVIAIDTASVNKLMNSFLASSGELPSKFLVRGDVILNPMELYANSNANIGVGRVNKRDSVFVNLDYAIPVAIGIKDGVLKNPPTEFSQTFSDTAQLGLIKKGNIYLDFGNSFPLDIELKLSLLKGILPGKTVPDTISAPVLTIPQNPADSANYPPLRIAADTTAARTGMRSFTFLTLTPDDARKLTEASFSAVELKMKTSGNGNVAKVFNMTDKLTMSVKANIVFLVSESKLK